MNSDDKTGRTDLAESRNELEDLLGQLLSEVPEPGVEAPVPASAPPAPAVAAPTAADPMVADPTIQVAVADAVAQPQPERTLPEPVQTESKETSAGPISREEGADAGPDLPEWAASDFKVLVVRVGRLRVAVPLVTLNGIAKLEPGFDATSMPGQPAWHRGVMRHRGGKLVLVDMADLLRMDCGEQQPGFLLLVGENRYGLQCDAIENPVTVTQSQVTWRLGDERRDWTFGMLPEHMCLLLDTDGIAARIG